MYYIYHFEDHACLWEINMEKQNKAGWYAAKCIFTTYGEISEHEEYVSTDWLEDDEGGSVKLIEKYTEIPDGLTDRLKAQYL